MSCLHVMLSAVALVMLACCDACCDACMGCLARVASFVGSFLRLPFCQRCILRTRVARCLRGLVGCSSPTMPHQPCTNHAPTMRRFVLPCPHPGALSSSPLCLPLSSWLPCPGCSSALVVRVRGQERGRTEDLLGIVGKVAQRPRYLQTPLSLVDEGAGAHCAIPTHFKPRSYVQRAPCPERQTGLLTLAP